jgi:hypothetical protein
MGNVAINAMVKLLKDMNIKIKIAIKAMIDELS